MYHLISDLHLPTIDDIREELARFTIDRIRKGTSVAIRVPASSSQTSALPMPSADLPNSAARAILKTCGLTGQVVEVDRVCARHVKLIMGFYYFEKSDNM